MECRSSILLDKTFRTMRLKSFSLKNFRGYRDEVRIDMSDLTVFVGRKDIG